MKDNFTKDNHYVAQSYLRRWESLPDKIWAYRLLVSHENVPLWSERSIKGIAYQQHLYSRNIADNKSDEIEKWFSREFESPAEEAVQRAITDQRLKTNDWNNLVRLLAMQDVRTPARLKEHMNSATKTTSDILKDILEELPTKWEQLKSSEISAPNPKASSSDFPLRITTEIKEGEEFGILKAETAVGRASWLWGIQHFLTTTVKILHEHHWTIMRPARGMYWPTSDKPVVRLNYSSEKNYNFNGGWGNKNSELLFPLGPEHLLYTKIGSRTSLRNKRLSTAQTRLIRRIIAENADRMVFARSADSEIPLLIPRSENAELYKHEEGQWASWATQQDDSEKYLFSKIKNA